MIELSDRKKQEVMEPLLNLNGSFEEDEKLEEPETPEKEEWVLPDILSRQQINQS